MIFSQHSLAKSSFELTFSAKIFEAIAKFGIMRLELFEIRWSILGVVVIEGHLVDKAIIKLKGRNRQDAGSEERDDALSEFHC